MRTSFPIYGMKIMKLTLFPTPLPVRGHRFISGLIKINAVQRNESSTGPGSRTLTSQPEKKAKSRTLNITFICHARGTLCGGM